MGGGQVNDKNWTTNLLAGVDSTFLFRFDSRLEFSWSSAVKNKSRKKDLVVVSGLVSSDKVIQREKHEKRKRSKKVQSKNTDRE